MTGEQFCYWLKGKIAMEGWSQKQAAQEWGISTAFLNDLLRGRREPSEKILEAVGYERVVRYHRKIPVDNRPDS